MSVLDDLKKLMAEAKETGFGERVGNGKMWVLYEPTYETERWFVTAYSRYHHHMFRAVESLGDGYESFTDVSNGVLTRRIMGGRRL